MTIAGWIFMTVSVASVLALTIYCVGKVFLGAPKE